MTGMTTCEACESMPAIVVQESGDDRNPYRLCLSCRDRLNARALRPLEWYNLAKRHSWSEYLLHDDFYDQDGMASQPHSGVEDVQLHRAPTLADVFNDAEALLDFSITRWNLDAMTKGAWRAIPSSSALRAISARFATTSNAAIRGTCLEIASITQGQAGADFVRYCWGEYPGVGLFDLARATAACLPFREGFDLVIQAVDATAGPTKRDAMLALSYFHSGEVLDWIERAIFEPVADSWGYLAAASSLDWPRVKSWIESGRPLSLVAIDAMRAIAQPMTPLLRDYHPVLGKRPDRQSFSSVLTKYLEVDPVPRVQNRVEWLLEHGNTLLKIG